jgi:hypothetical protein
MALFRANDGTSLSADEATDHAFKTLGHRGNLDKRVILAALTAGGTLGWVSLAKIVASTKSNSSRGYVEAIQHREARNAMAARLKAKVTARAVVDEISKRICAS